MGGRCGRFQLARVGGVSSDYPMILDECSLLCLDGRRCGPLDNDV